MMNPEMMAGAVLGGKEATPEEEMQKQLLQAQMLRQRMGPQHSTVLGTMLGGLGEMGQQVGSDLQGGYQNGANMGKRLFQVGGFKGGMPFGF